MGAILNALGILAGALLGLLGRGALSARTEAFFKSIIAALTTFCGLRLIWFSLEGTWFTELKQIFLTVLAVVLGGLLGKLLHLQRASNRLGRQALVWLTAAQKNPPGSAHDGFLAATILFCAAPLGIIGAVADGLAGYFPFLAIKALMDGLAMAGFIRLFRWPMALAAGPVYIFLQVITLAAHDIALPALETHHLTNSVNAAAGLLACLVTLVVLGARRVELAGYLPALVVAPLLARFLL